MNMYSKNVGPYQSELSDPLLHTMDQNGHGEEKKNHLIAVLFSLHTCVCVTIEPFILYNNSI